jgi:hypothetical protein
VSCVVQQAISLIHITHSSEAIKPPNGALLQLHGWGQALETFDAAYWQLLHEYGHYQESCVAFEEVVHVLQVVSGSHASYMELVLRMGYYIRSQGLVDSTG